MVEVKAGEMRFRGLAAQDQSVCPTNVEDHTKANRELENLATRKGWTLPKTIDEKCQKELDTLAGTTAQEFDRTYMEGQLKAHEAAVKLFENESRSGQGCCSEIMGRQDAADVARTFTTSEGNLPEEGPINERRASCPPDAGDLKDQSAGPFRQCVFFETRRRA